MQVDNLDQLRVVFLVVEFSIFKTMGGLAAAVGVDQPGVEHGVRDVLIQADGCELAPLELLELLELFELPPVVGKPRLQPARVGRPAGGGVRISCPPQPSLDDGEGIGVAWS